MNGLKTHLTKLARRHPRLRQDIAPVLAGLESHASKTAAGSESFHDAYARWWSEMREEVLRGVTKLRNVAPMSATDYSGSSTRYLLVGTAEDIKWGSLDVELRGDYRDSRHSPGTVYWEINYGPSATYGNERAPSPVEVKGSFQVDPRDTGQDVVAKLGREIAPTLRNIT